MQGITLKQTMEGKGWNIYIYIQYTKTDQNKQTSFITFISLCLSKKNIFLVPDLLLLPSAKRKLVTVRSPVKTWECPTGTVNAGFGTTWSREAAEGRSYQQQLAIQELQVAMQGTTMPKTDDAETLGAETPSFFLGGGRVWLRGSNERMVEILGQVDV